MQLTLRLLLLLVCLMAGGAVAPLHAQSTTGGVETTKPVVIDKRKLLVQPRNADGSLIEPAFMEDPVLWMRIKQQNFYARMSTAMRQLNSSSSGSAAWTLFTLSFLYGVFHAAGPGHGKAVITGWVLATENELKRGLVIAFLSAMIQALTAIILVSVLLLFVQGASAMARDVAGFLESASYLMIAGMGAYLIWTGWRGLAHAEPAPKPVPQFELLSRPGDGHANAIHIHDEHCGHAHAPAAADVRGDWSWRKAVALAFAVGIRPCSGAILVLIFSYPLGLYAAGVASVLAMGLGVFITIAAMATLAVFAKSAALRFAGVDNRWLGLAVRWGKTAVGLGIVGLGGLLFLGSLGASNMSM